MLGRCICLVMALALSHSIAGQGITRSFKAKDYKEEDFKHLDKQKKIPPSIRPQVLTALSFYPELADLKIVFRLKKRKTPLASRPRLFSVFRKKKNRRYLITISYAAKADLTPILFKNLPYNAQIGVLGHELAHVLEYNATSTFKLIGIGFSLVDGNFVDRFEWATDQRTIAQGLGYQLYDWSTYVRKALNIPVWRGVSNNAASGVTTGAKERYMHPETILKQMALYPIYDNP